MAGKEGKKSRKHGRNLRSPAMKRYHAEYRDRKNKLKKLVRHLKKHPNDKNCCEGVKRLAILGYHLPGDCPNPC